MNLVAMCFIVVAPAANIIVVVSVVVFVVEFVGCTITGAFIFVFITI